MKYLFIDGNNMAIRSAFSCSDLKSSTGIPTGVHYGFFQSLINLKQKFPKHQFLICWDGKNERRKIESELAVKQGIIPAAYKANRKVEPAPQPLLDFYKQAPFLKRALGYTGIPQIQYNNYEADDVICSYCNKLKSNNEIVCVTSDKDYFALLDDTVSMFDGMKNKTFTKTFFKEEYGIDPTQWTDIGSFQGDDGDNIFGVPGWGEKTAVKVIKKFKTWEKTLDVYKKIYNAERQKYPDLKDYASDGEGEKKFKEISDLKSEKGRYVYPEISFNMPFTGVLYAFDKNLISGVKGEIMALMFEERIRLAYSLKKMDIEIPNLPKIESMEFNGKRILEYFNYYDIESLQDAIELFDPKIENSKKELFS